jgi:alpha-L-fucosidase
MNYHTIKTGLLLMALSRVVVFGADDGTYEPNWESLSKHKAAPEWLEDAKLGIYFHWGVYSVPAYGNEWYPCRMHQEGSDTSKHHIETYGDPSEFGYHDFVPMFTAEHFDPEEWAELFRQAGARFAGPVAEHHDGYSMWASKITPWNAKDTGPKRDILGDLFRSLEKRGMKTIATFHHARNLQAPGTGHYRTGVKNWPPNSEDPKLQFLYGKMDPDQWREQVWLGKLIEVIDNYQPDIIWFDSWLDRIPETHRQRFAAYYLNEAAKWGKEVAIIRKQNDMPLSFTINDHEKSREPKALPELWMTDDTISTGSWCYTENLRIKSLDKVLHSLIDTAAKNGVMLLNVSPKADGTIPQDQRSVLIGLGKWLQVNGESIYDTRPWVIAAEGPTAEPEGGFKNADKFLRISYSAKDIRFTRSKDNKTLYATALGWPGETMVIESLADLDLAGISSVRLLSVDEELGWKQTDEGLEIAMPSKPDYGVAFPVRICFKETIPQPPSQ